MSRPPSKPPQNNFFKPPANFGMVNQADRLFQQGFALFNQGRLELARDFFEKVVKINSRQAHAFHLLGIISAQLKDFQKAVSFFDKAVKINCNDPILYLNRGNAYFESNQIENALINYNKAVALQPNFADAYCYKSIALTEQNHLIDALLNINKAISIKPDYSKAFLTRANILKELKHFDEALKSYDKAIELKNDNAEAYCNRGNLLLELKLFEEALQSYNRAIELQHHFAEAYQNRGNLFKEIKNYDEGLKNFRKAIELKPDDKNLFCIQLHTKMFVSDWQGFDDEVQRLSVNIKEGKKSSEVFAVLALTDSLSVQRKASELWLSEEYPLNISLGAISKYSRKDKIRIGYYSADFKEHPVSYLTAELFEIHNKNRFELIAFSNGNNSENEMRKRLIISFDKFIDIRLQSDEEVAVLSRELEIDIAIDLTGLTADHRIGIFSYRAAPVQLSYIGYLGTMGAEYYDYLIADKIIIPVESQQYYKEKIVYLPSYQVNDSKRVIADKVFTKSELNLPDKNFVFCCFNNNYKITPPTFDGWMRILTAVPDSVLFLYADNKWAEDNLKLEAEKRGVSQTRLVFGARISRGEYLARYRAADLFLDTLPYNAGTTASDALWAGLPVLTCMGESFASRVAASLLNAIELPELITTTQEQYEATAIELATNPAKLKEIKDKLERNRLTTALFDTPRFTKHIEAAYTQMYERYQADLPKDNIYIEN